MSSALPPKELRRCGNSFPRDDYWVGTAMAEAERLDDYYGLSPKSRILDVGCGVARLLTGIVEKKYKYTSYTGLDVDKKALNWCKTLKSPKNFFVHMDIFNERFNKTGTIKMDENFQIPLKDGSYDIIYSWAVFTHLRLNDAGVYLKEFARLLSPKGSIFVTAHVEEGVPAETENPDNYPPKYGKGDCGALHRMRFSKIAFLKEIYKAGLRVDKFNHNAAWNHQTTIKLALR